MELLRQRGAEVAYSDYNVSTLNLNGTSIKSLGLDPARLGKFDAVVILANHDDYYGGRNCR